MRNRPSTGDQGSELKSPVRMMGRRLLLVTAILSSSARRRADWASLMSVLLGL